MDKNMELARRCMLESWPHSISECFIIFIKFFHDKKSPDCHPGVLSIFKKQSTMCLRVQEMNCGNAPRYAIIDDSFLIVFLLSWCHKTSRETESLGPLVCCGVAKNNRCGHAESKLDIFPRHSLPAKCRPFGLRMLHTAWNPASGFLMERVFIKRVYCLKHSCFLFILEVGKKMGNKRRQQVSLLS